MGKLRFVPKHPNLRFVVVEPCKDQAKAGPVINTGIKIKCGKFTIAIDSGVDASLLAGVIRLMEAHVCGQ